MGTLPVQDRINGPGWQEDDGLGARPPFDPRGIAETKVPLTMFGGRIVHDARRGGRTRVQAAEVDRDFR